MKKNDKFNLMNIIQTSISLSILLIFLCSCQKSPSNSLFDKKNYREFSKMLERQATETDILEYPELFSEKVISKDGIVEINFDANLSVPNVEKYPVIRMNIHPFTKDTIIKVANEFTEGEDGFYPENYMTKNDIEENILWVKSILNNKEQLQEELGNGEAYNKYEEACLQSLQYYEDKLINAPIERRNIQTNFTLRPLDFYMDENYTGNQDEINLSTDELSNRENDQSENLYLISYNSYSDGSYTRLSVYHDYLKNVLYNYSYFKREQYQIQFIKTYTPLIYSFDFAIDNHLFNTVRFTENIDSKYPKLSINEEQAVKIADKALEQLGMSNFYLADSRIIKRSLSYRGMIKKTTSSNDEEKKHIEESKDDIAYLLTYKPMYRNIPLLVTSQSFVNEIEYYMRIETEEIKLRVTNDMIAEFRWTNPTDVSNVINDNVKLVDFETIIEKAKEFVKVKYNIQTIANVNPESSTYEDDIKDYTSANIEITDIRLGLGCIPEYNNPNEFILIPVWNFYGSYTITHKVDGESNICDALVPLISINAIDGSIISQKSIINYD